MSGDTPFYVHLSIGDSFLGARAQRLADLLSEQGDAFMRKGGITIPARCSSTVLYLHTNGPSSLVQIAQALSEPHQVTAKRIAGLEQLSILTLTADPNDGRRRIIQLTRKGKRESALIEDCCSAASRVFKELNQELGVEVGKVLDDAIAALGQKTMLDRVSQSRRPD